MKKSSVLKKTLRSLRDSLYSVTGYRNAEYNLKNSVLNVAA